MIFLGADLSNAENRIVLALTREPSMLALARSKPWELDLHTENVTIIFGTPAAQVTGDERFLGKVVSHGAQRGMGGRTLSDRILKQLGVVLTPEECDRHIAAYMRRYWPVKDYFKDIKLQVLKYKALANTWGRIMRFAYDNFQDDAVFREAYSFLPQSEIIDLMNMWGFKPWSRWLQQHTGKPVVHHGHDSLTACVPAALAYDAALALRATLERPRVYYNNELTIPVVFSLGKTWRMSVEYKQLPSRAEFTAAARALEV